MCRSQANVLRLSLYTYKYVFALTKIPESECSRARFDQKVVDCMWNGSIMIGFQVCRMNFYEYNIMFKFCDDMMSQ